MWVEASDRTDTYCSVKIQGLDEKLSIKVSFVKDVLFNIENGSYTSDLPGRQRQVTIVVLWFMYTVDDCTYCFKLIVHLLVGMNTLLYKRHKCRTQNG